MSVRFLACALCAAGLLTASALPSMAQSLKANPARSAYAPLPDSDTPTQGQWGDRGDGTYANPVLPADFSDQDAIRIGSDYYAVSSTFQYSPGVVILHSKDLVNWTILGHAVSDITQIGPDLNWDKMDRYGKGVWAGSLRYHAGKFWLYFNTPDEGFFMTTARDPAGPWEPLTSVWRTSGWDDPCPFWDDDGQGYLVTTHYADGYKIHLFKMAPDGKSLLMNSDKAIHQSHGSEANKLYKINGLYYHYYSEVQGEGRVVMMERAKSLDGPWEMRQLNHVNACIDKEPNQGGLIDLPDGRWYFFTHQGTGDWEGRAACLLPVTWTDGWPVIGKVGPDGIGNMVWHAPKPITGFPSTQIQTNDEFTAKTLATAREWNYQPRADKWSLTERPAWLRLHAFKPLSPGDFKKAGNTLTQRSVRTPHNSVTVKLDLTGMAEGQQAGFAHYAGPWATFGVTQANGTKTLTYTENGYATPGPAITQNALWLRSEWGFDGKSQFSYSLDGKTFLPFGPVYQLAWGNYRGDRIGLFTFNDAGDSGYVDIDWFHYDVSRAAPGVN